MNAEREKPVGSVDDNASLPDWPGLKIEGGRVAEGSTFTDPADASEKGKRAFSPQVLTEMETPLVHSTLLEMIGLANAGKCMACAGEHRTLAELSQMHGCCPVKFAERHHEYLRWKQRTMVLMLARKYSAGELGKVSNHDAVSDAAAGER